MFKSRYFAARYTSARYFNADPVITTVIKGIRRMVWFG